MLIAIQSDPHYQPLLGDAELAALLTAEREVQAMMQVELALAEAQATLGLIPKEAADHMAMALPDATLDTARVADGTRLSGVPIPALLAEWRGCLPDTVSQWLHWGATSQDILDTATMLQLSECLTLLDSRLAHLLVSLKEQSDRHDDTLFAARTRTQLATPITLGLRLAQWMQPLIHLENTLPELRQRVLRVQFGGASGANTAVAPHGAAIAARMASRLGLADAPPWHTDRSALLGIAGWLMQVCVANERLGRDLMILSRSEIAELRAGSAGGSSTMPQKANPVQSEILVSLASVARALHAGLASASSPVEERDGASWTVEWILLPQLLLTTAASLRHAGELASSLVADTARMQDRIHSNTALMAETASLTLASHMPRTEAQQRVKQAVASGEPLADALTRLAEVPVDWHAVLNPERVISACRPVHEQILTLRRQGWP